MEKLEKLAVRIGAISNEIKDLKSNREINLDKCSGSEELSDLGPLSNCLYNAYMWVKEDREEYISSFDEVINPYTKH